MPQAESITLPKRIPLMIEPQNRAASTDKDSRLVNCFVETQDTGGGKEQWIYSRPGLDEASRPPAANATGRGVFNWLGDIYSIFGNKLYKNGVALAGTVDTSNGVYKFDSCLGATPKLQIGNGVKGYNYDSGAGLVLIVDPDFPPSFVKGWAYLNGTSYVMTPTAHIQGDDINDPVNWDPLNDILAQIEPDQGKALAKQLVYVIALKQWSTEVFYDAGNAVGSPLGQVQGAKQNYGCVSSDSVQDIDGALYWVCSSKTAGCQVAAMDQLKLDIISTKPIERLLQDADWSTTFSWQVSVQGHRFYVVTTKVSNLTIAYDLDEKLWHQWTDVNGNYMPIVASTYDSSSRAILQHESNGRLYYCNATYTNDDGVKIVSDIITPNFDAGVQSRGKYLPIMRFVADTVSGSELQVRHNDNDYDRDSWSTPRRVDLSQKLPTLENCGSFNRRAWWLRHESNTRMRIKAVEVQLDLCTLPVP